MMEGNRRCHIRERKNQRAREWKGTFFVNSVLIERVLSLVDPVCDMPCMMDMCVHVLSGSNDFKPSSLKEKRECVQWVT